MPDRGHRRRRQRPARRCRDDDPAPTAARPVDRRRLAPDPRPPRNRKEAAHPLFGDRLTWPACHTTRQNEYAAAERRHRAALDRPRIKTLALTTRLGDGWSLTQREGDAELERWLVEHDGTVHGYVNRYLRANKTFSPGWEAFLDGTTRWYRLDAISSCQHRPGSSFLWSGRDLAARGIATRPRHNAPRPTWATHTRKTARPPPSRHTCPPRPPPTSPRPAPRSTTTSWPSWPSWNSGRCPRCS
ncbi:MULTISPECIES: hypothetical protein [unclassified Streptomyces]|uniref:hypothetical protein n=1 Tax=unclassified Streptomyces TaxID=2593676 RepID=UPI00117F5632|nr:MULTISPECIES: hypothetical protein [unclassified Streptomyces]